MDYIILHVSDPAQTSVLYRGTETSTNIRVAAGDPFSLVCKVGFFSRMGSGTWPPVVKWYDYGNQEVSSGPGTASNTTVRQETLLTATEEMQGKRFRCRTNYTTSANIDADTRTHTYSKVPPAYETDDYITIANVDCKYCFFS